MFYNHKKQLEQTERTNDSWQENKIARKSFTFYINQFNEKNVRLTQVRIIKVIPLDIF